MFWVISVYFNVRNILPKPGTFPPGHPVYYKKYSNFTKILIVGAELSLWMNGRTDMMKLTVTFFAILKMYPNKTDSYMPQVVEET